MQRPDPSSSRWRLFRPTAMTTMSLLLLTGTAMMVLAGDRDAVEYPPTTLRGYGKLSAIFTRLEGNTSHLCIQCADEAKARIAHAKYVSDLHAFRMPKDEKLELDGVNFTVTVAPTQGQTTAFRKGNTVHVVSAPDAPALKFALKKLKKEWKSAELTPSGAVPMYLDAWDRYGWRFYYWPFQLPNPKPGEKRIEWRNYNVLGEFDFAKQSNHAGLVCWLNEERADCGEGMNNQPLWDWVADAAARRHLPFVVNGFTGDAIWLVNRYRDETQQRAPNYCGGYYTAGDSFHAGFGHISWSSTGGRDAVLSAIQQCYRYFAKQPNTIEYLEPHGEIRHGEHDILTEYGPVADRTYRIYLKEQYQTVKAVSQRWFGSETTLRSWNDVRVPELAEFLGFGTDALDLGGSWRVMREEVKDNKPVAAPEEWYKPEFDDTAWPEVVAPQSDIAMFLGRKSSVFRRHFTVDPAWRAKQERVWLHIFDLNRARKEKMPVYLNGRKVGESTVENLRHHTVVEVTDALQDGANLLATRMTEGFIGYRVYLTGQEPKQYPYLGQGKNAQWTDFVRWQAWTRMESVRRGLEMIRQVDPNRSVVCMAPDAYYAGLKRLCEDYGGHFHNTGYMSGWWAEPLMMLMRSSNLPFSLEPGGPAPDLPEFKRFLGHWLTEGVNAVHYFIHIGDVYWHEDIKAYFEDMQPVIQAIGKMHVPKAEIATLLSDDVENLTGWPWDHGKETNLPNGYVPYQINMGLRKEYHMDALVPDDFARGNADAYRIVIDTNNCVMDDSLVSDIEAWVRKGGVFITATHTGRHTPEKADAWPISRLTGYKVKEIVYKSRKMKFVPGQTVFDEKEWNEGALRGDGLMLEKVAEDCTDVMRWEDGSTAIGFRHVGKGIIVHVGWQWNYNPFVYGQILKWLKPKRLHAVCSEPAVFLSHLVSNNGLYDVWVLWNNDKTKTLKTDLTFRDGLKPAYCTELKTGQTIELVPEGESLKAANLELVPQDIRVFLTPRSAFTNASQDWLTLQRGWWAGGDAKVNPIPEYQARFAYSISEDWKMKPLDEADKTDVTPMAAPDFDASSWKTSRLGSWLVPDDLPTHRAIFRRSFTVPANWTNGDVELWMVNWTHDAVRGRLRAWLDGEALAFPGSSIKGLRLGAKLKPGTEHVLAAEVFSEGQVAGFICNAWLYYRMSPRQSQDLAGTWIVSRDGLTWKENASFPGPWDFFFARRKVKVDGALAGHTALIRIETAQQFGLYGVMVNGHWVMRLHHEVGTFTELNVTPWVRFGEENEIHIVRRDGPGKGEIKSVHLDYYKAGEYP